MNLGISLYETVMDNSDVRPEIHNRLAEELEAFTKPTIDPSNYVINERLAVLLCLCSRQFRDIIGPDLVQRLTDLSKEILATWNTQVQPDTSKAWCSMALTNAYESRVKKTVTVTPAGTTITSNPDVDGVDVVAPEMTATEVLAHVRVNPFTQPVRETEPGEVAF